MPVAGSLFFAMPLPRDGVRAVSVGKEKAEGNV